MQREVETPFRRPEIYRAREGVVDQRQQAMLAGEFYHPMEIGNADKGVSNGFDVNRLGARLQLMGPVFRCIAVDEIDLNAKARELRYQQRVSATIQTILRKQMIACAEQRQHCRRDCRHSTRSN